MRVPRQRRGTIVDDRGVPLHRGFKGPLEFSERLPPFKLPTPSHHRDWATLRLRACARSVATTCAAQRQQRQGHRPVLREARFFGSRTHRPARGRPRCPSELAAMAEPEEAEREEKQRQEQELAATDHEHDDDDREAHDTRALCDTNATGARWVTWRRRLPAASLAHAELEQGDRRHPRRVGKKAPAAAPPPFHALLINGSEYSLLTHGHKPRRTQRLALQLELCLPRLLSSPEPGGAIDTRPSRSAAKPNADAAARSAFKSTATHQGLGAAADRGGRSAARGTT